MLNELKWVCVNRVECNIRLYTLNVQIINLRLRGSF